MFGTATSVLRAVVILSASYAIAGRRGSRDRHGMHQRACHPTMCPEGPGSTVAGVSSSVPGGSGEGLSAAWVDVAHAMDPMPWGP